MAPVIILILFAGLMLIPAGICASYTAEGFTASARVWFCKLRLYPPKGKKPKAADAEPTEADADKKPWKNPLSGFELNDWLRLAKAALRTLHRFKNGVYFDIIRLKVLVSDPDPYDAVTRYNAVNGFVGAAIPFFESGFRVKDKDIYVGLDMSGSGSRAEAELSASVRIGTVLAVGLAAGFAFLKILIKNRIRRIRERVARNGEQQTERNDAVDNEQHQESC